MSSLENDVASSSQQNRPDLALLFLLIPSLALNVILGWKLRQHDNLSVPVLAVGSYVPDIVVQGPAGLEQAISFSGTKVPTVLYVLTPTCKWCDRNMSNVKTIAGLAGDKYRFVGLSLKASGLDAYIRRHGIDFPVYSSLSGEIREKLKLGNTPQTIVISAQGRVIKNWVGAYTGVVQAEIESYFQTRLPGLSYVDE